METAYQIAPSLSTLFNRFLDSGFLPEEWKLANIIPAFEKGDKTHVKNYRPISPLCVVSRVFERCILNKLRDHLLKLVNSSRGCLSILGPILFHLHVNDYPDSVQNSRVACFADDTNIFCRVDSISDAALLQDDLSNPEKLSSTEVSCLINSNISVCV